MGDEGINFDEGTFIQQQPDTVPCCAPTARPNRFLTLQTPAKSSLLSLELEVFETVTRVPCHTISTPSRFLIKTLKP
jgi:hypothetical protein